jgi:hypothetical protein
VLARALEWSFAGRISASSVGFASCGLAITGVLLLNTVPAAIGFGLLFAFCHGAALGILTIARGTVPAELFGPQPQGGLLGALGRPSFAARALAPGLFALGLSAGVSMQTGLRLLVVVSTLALICFWLATRALVGEENPP